MSINRLSLQIGGGDQKEYEKRKVMREVAKPNTDIDDAVVLFFEENVLPALNGETTGPAREEIVYREPRSNVDVLSNYITKTVREEPEGYQTPRSLRESYTLEDRLSLLEQDVFTKMAQATPNTLVSGIGASLDSGGGAVWLWDLEDVNIGVPFNGAYPSVTDGSFLAYNAATKAWNAVEDSGAANALSGAVIKATGGSANSGGNLVIEATNPTDGNFIIKNADSVDKLIIDGSTGDATFKGGRVIIERATSTNTFLVKGKTVDFPQDANSVLLGTVTASGDASDSVRYFGTVTNDNDITTKKYVDNALNELDPTGGFTFKGNTDVTGPAPDSPESGDFYINTVAGTASASWIGIANVSIASDQLIIYSGESSRWFAGAVEGAGPNVLKAGDTMTGTLTIAPTSGNDSLVIKSGDTTNITLFAGGSANFTGSVTGGNFSAKNIKPATDDTYVLGDSDLSWSSAHINELNSAGIVNSGALLSSGDTALGTQSPNTRIIFGNNSMINQVPDGSYLFKGGKSANLRIGRCNDNNMATAQIIIEGKRREEDAVKTNILLGVYRLTSVDSIRYYGRTSGDDDIQNKTSALGLITDGGWTVTGDATFDGSSFLNGNTTTQSISVGGSAIFNGNATFIAELNNGPNGHVLLTRPTGSNWFRIQGRTQDAGSLTNTLFDVVKGPGDTTDKIVYYGDSVGAGTIQTKDSVQSMIDSQLQEDEYTFFNYLNVEDADTDCGGTIWYVKAKLCQAGTAVSIIINMGNRGSFMGTGTKICKLPSQFCGTKNVAIPVVSKLLDTPITTGMVYLNSGTGQLTLAQTIPADSVSAEWEGAMVYGID